MWNLWDLIVSAIVWVIDGIVLPILIRLSVGLGGGTLDGLLEQYIKIPFQLLYPILAMFNLLPLMMAVSFSATIFIAKKFVAAYMFVLDLLPGLR